MGVDPTLCGQVYLWVGGPGFWEKKKAGRANQEERAGEQHPSTSSVSAPASRFLLCPDFLQGSATLWKCKSNKPFPPQVIFGHGILWQ